MTPPDAFHSPLHHTPSTDLAAHLDREAALAEGITARTVEAAADALDRPVHTVLDLGSGTGAAAITLAHRFPDAQVHCLDLSADLMERAKRAVASAGLADRVHPHVIDLDDDWTMMVPEGVDLIWASMSLHHVAQPSDVLGRALSALRPGGVVVVTEMSEQFEIAPDDLDTGREGLAGRVADGLKALGYPITADWGTALAEAGFTTVRTETTSLTVTSDTTNGSTYLATHVSRWRESLAQDLPSDDLAALAEVENTIRAGSSPLTVTSGRTVWLATRPENDTETTEADVVVVGGGAAGLAAAIALGRSRRSVVVIDAGEPRNAPAAGIHNALGHEGAPPLEVLAKGRAEARSYGVNIIRGAVTDARGAIDDFTVDIDGGRSRVHARRVILATGLVDDLPDVPGVREAWGRTVLHCAFCHGWEVRDQRIAILARDEVPMHQAMLFRQLSESVTLFLHEAADPTPVQSAQLVALGIPVIRCRVERLVLDGSQVRGVQCEGGNSYDADAVVVTPRFTARTGLYEALGGETTTTPLGQWIASDARGTTAVPGVFAAGNAAEPMAMFVTSAASGVAAGVGAHGDLALADLIRAT